MTDCDPIMVVFSSALRCCLCSCSSLMIHARMRWIVSKQDLVSSMWPMGCGMSSPMYTSWLAHASAQKNKWCDSHNLTTDMLNCFKDYKRYIHILNCILDLDEINSRTTYVVCPTQPIPCLQEPVHQHSQSQNIPSPPSEELTWKQYTVKSLI